MLVLHLAVQRVDLTQLCLVLALEPRQLHVLALAPDLQVGRAEAWDLWK